MEECCGSAGQGNMGDFIDLAGGSNIAKDLLPGALGTVNLEQVLAADPQGLYRQRWQSAWCNFSGRCARLGAQATKAEAQASLQSVKALTS